METHGWGNLPDTLITNNEHLELKYSNEPFNNQQDIENWHKKGWPKSTKFTGDLCDMRKQQPSYNQDVVDWAANTFKLKNIGTAYYRMGTGVILPTHRDTYQKYIQMFGCDLNSIIRILVFLDDWRPGHIFQLDDNLVRDYPRWTYYWWRGDYPHMAANLGDEYRYTLQITGTEIESQL
jgi:hypothetical protein